MRATNVKTWIGMIAAGVLILVGWLFLRAPEDAPNGPKPIRSDRERPDSVSSEGGELIEGRHIRSEPQDNPRFVATLLAHPPEPEILDKIEYPKFSRTGSGTRGSIRDAEGGVIWRASEDNPVFSISISPNDARIVAGAGDGNAYVITSDGEKLMDLPQFPPGKDMLGLGNWVWLDNERLLGESGVQKFDEHGRPVGCCQGHNVSESRFYVYDLRTNQMEEMQLPENLREKAVSIGKVLKTGELQLGHEGDGFGWYQVTDLEENR